MEPPRDEPEGGKGGSHGEEQGFDDVRDAPFLRDGIHRRPPARAARPRRRRAGLSPASATVVGTVG